MRTVSKLIITGKIVLSIILGLFVTAAVVAAAAAWFEVFVYAISLWLIGALLVVSIFGFSWLLLRKPSYKKIKTEGIDILPAVAVELIDDIIGAMRYRKGVRADVRQELADHFADALRDCKTDEDKSECIAEMADGFGDSQLLGVLVRRGKKRCRPMWQKVIGAIPLAIVYSFLLLILYVGWFFTGKPAVTTDYLVIWNQQIRPVADDSQNAEPFYSKAAGAYNADAITPAEDSGDDKFDKSPRSLSVLSEDELAIVKRWLADNTSIMELIRQGNAKPYYWMDYAIAEEGSTELLAVLMPHLGDYKDIARMLCWQAILQADKGQVDEAFEMLDQVFIFGSHIRSRKTTLIEQLVAISIEKMASQTRRIILADNIDKLNAQTLAKAAKQFEQTIAKVNFKVDFSGDQMFIRDEIQRSFVESRFGKDHLYLPRITTLGEMDFDDLLDSGVLGAYGFKVLFTHPDKEETLKSAEQYFAAVSKLADKTPASLKADGDPMRQLTEDICRENIFLAIMMPALRKVVELSYRGRIEAEATLTIMAVLQYQKQNSQFPESLQVLVDSGLLLEIPHDPYSDRPLAYKKTTEGFTLYSFGENMVDDGGVADPESKHRRIWSDEGDTVFWPVEK